MGSLTSYKKTKKHNLRKVHLEQKVFVFNHTPFSVFKVTGIPSVGHEYIQ